MADQRVLYIYSEDPVVPLDDAARYWNEATGVDIVRVVDDPELANVIVTTLPEEHKKFQGRFRGKYGDKPDVILLTPEALSALNDPNVQDKYTVTVVAHEIGHALGLKDKDYGGGGIMAGRIHPSEKEATIVSKKAGFASPYPIKVFVRGAHPSITEALQHAVQMWNDAVGTAVLQIAPPGTEDAVPIRVANLKNHWYDWGVSDKFAPDEEAETTGLTGSTDTEIHGTRPALRNEESLTLAHELGHVLGLFHPFPTSTAERYIPASYARVRKFIKEPWAWKVAPVGIMGNQMDPASPDFRGRGPSHGEVTYLRNLVRYHPPEPETSSPGGKGVVHAGPPPHRTIQEQHRDPRQR